MTPFRKKKKNAAPEALRDGLFYSRKNTCDSFG